VNNEPKIEQEKTAEEVDVMFWSAEMLAQRVRNGYMTHKEMENHLELLEGSFNGGKR
jgi:hypothetical protein